MRAVLALGRFGIGASRVRAMSWAECERYIAAARGLDAAQSAIASPPSAVTLAPRGGNTVHYRSRRRNIT